MSEDVDFEILINETNKDDTYTYQLIGSALRSICKKIIFQLEANSESYDRYFHVKCRYFDETTQSNAGQLLMRVLNILDMADAPTIRPMHYDGTHGDETHDDETHDFAYVVRGVPIYGPWNDYDFGESVEHMYTPYEHTGISYDTFHPFQKSLYNMSNNVDHHAIDIIYDPLGGNGITMISTYLAQYDNCYIIPDCSNYQEILLNAYRHAQYLKSQFGDRTDSRCRNIKAFILDLSRGFNMEVNLIIHAIETIKNGILIDHRFSYKIHRINPPRVFIFCNKNLELSFFLKYHINLWTIENKNLIPLYK